MTDTMTSKQRFLTALKRKEPDRLPITSHHVMEYFLNRYAGGIDAQEFFDSYGLDPITWLMPLKLEEKQFWETSSVGTQQICSPEWIISAEEIPDPEYCTYRYTITTPGGCLTSVLQSNNITTWVAEPLVKQNTDIDIIMNYAPLYSCDIEEVNSIADSYGERGLVRGTIPGFELFGQPGCWQDMACLVGIEKLIFRTFDDPGWVNTFLKWLMERKLYLIRSLKGARFDLIELGGGDASTTVISPGIFNEYVAPYDSELIGAAAEAGQRIVYHTCGGMMPILEDIVAMGPTAIETLTPPGMGGDVDLAEAKRRVGDKVCLIGGFDQGYYFSKASEAETRKAVRDAFEAAGAGGGLILSPSDHFFDADPKLIKAFADEGRKCRY